MHTYRRNLIVNLAVDYLNNNSDDLLLNWEVPIEYQNEPDVEIDGKVMMPPCNRDFSQWFKAKKGGTWRTKELILMALNLLRENIDRILDDYPYYGNSEVYAQTHITFEEVNFKTPTLEEIDELLANLNNIYKLYPAINLPQQAWDVYDYVAEDELGAISLFQHGRQRIDTVFFNANCDRDYVKRSLIGHDGYNETIEIARRETALV